MAAGTTLGSKRIQAWPLDLTKSQLSPLAEHRRLLGSLAWTVLETGGPLEVHLDFPKSWVEPEGLPEMESGFG